MLPSLSSLSSAELTTLLANTLAAERLCVIDSLHLFIEMERRGTHKELSHHSSLFSYCVEELHLSEGYTYRRLTAARLLSQFPAIERFLRDGLVSLSNLVLLKDVLTQTSHLDVLSRATHRTKEQVKELLAELQPRPDVSDSVRRLPVRAAAATAAPLLVSTPPSTSVAPRPPPAPLPTPTPTPATSDIDPLSPRRYLLKATISADVKAKLEKVQAALSHVIPDGNLEEVLDEALTLALQVLAKQHRVAAPAEDVKPVTFAAKVDEPELSENENTRYIPADVKRDVRARDEDRCTFVGANGCRCRSTHQLEFHHRQGFARGGPPTRDNITLHCRAHNAWQATLDYGAEHMQQFRKSG